VDYSPVKIERWLPVSAALLLFSGLCCLAGDPIVFSNPKSKTDPGKEAQKEQERELSKPWKPDQSFDIELTLPRPGFRGPRKLTKEEKQRRNEQEEKKNWLLLRPGQLQEDEERKNQMGVRDYDLQKAGDENAPRDYTFYGLGGSKTADMKGKASQDRGDGKGQRNDQPRRDDAARASDDDEDREPSSNSGTGNQAGAHTASELDLKTLLNPSQKNARGSEKTEFTLRDLLNSTTAPRSREQTERINAWRRDVLNSPDSGGSSPALSESTKSDFTRATPTPAFAKPLDSPAKSSSGGNTIYNPNLGLSGPAGPRGGIMTPGLPDTRNFATPGNLGPSYPGLNPAYNQQDSQNSLQRAQPSLLEAPRRKF
jgi:hypothetical protein